MGVYCFCTRYWIQDTKKYMERWSEVETEDEKGEIERGESGQFRQLAWEWERVVVHLTSCFNVQCVYIKYYLGPLVWLHSARVLCLEGVYFLDYKPYSPSLKSYFFSLPPNMLIFTHHLSLFLPLLHLFYPCNFDFTFFFPLSSFPFYSPPGMSPTFMYFPSDDIGQWGKRIFQELTHYRELVWE